MRGRRRKREKEGRKVRDRESGRRGMSEEG